MLRQERLPKELKIRLSLLRLQMKLWLSNVTNVLRHLKKNRFAMAGATVVLVFVLASMFAPYITPVPPEEVDLSKRFVKPSWISEHPFGTDHLGRDIFTRIVYGARVSILVGVITVGISLIIGGTLGMIAGYYGGVFDSALSRFTEILLAFPYLIFAIGAMSVLGPGFWNLIWALSFKTWVEFFRLARAGVLAEKARDYVDAAKVLGRSDFAILTSEILPNMINPLIVVGTLRMGTMMVMEASLSFLGIGIPPRIPAWGSMIRDGYRFVLNAWWLSVLPGLFLVLLVLSINVVGEALRDLLDPDFRGF